MPSCTACAAIARARKNLERKEKALTKASMARFNLWPGSSRTRVTTANARWSTAAEARDRAASELSAAEVAGPEEHEPDCENRTRWNQ